MREAGELTNYMKLDLESLYIFGTMALDQWGLQAIHLSTLPLAKKHPFVEVVSALEANKAETIGGIWSSEREKMLWLHYQIRFYRNRFVTHTNRPWQRGNTRAVFGEDFRLFTPTPPGWLDDEECDLGIMSLLPLAPELVQRMQKRKRRPRALIEFLFEGIGQQENRTDRERIAELYGKVGGQTPSFQTIAERLFDFVKRSTSTLIEIAVANPEKIDLGPPVTLNEDLLAGALRKPDPRV